LGIFPRRFIGGFLEIESELLDQLLKLDRIPTCGIDFGPIARELVVHPLAGGRIGNRSDVGRDLGRLFAHRRRTEHNRQTTIKPVVHPEVQRQACNHTSGDGKRGSKRPAARAGRGRAQLLGYRGQNAWTKPGWCALRPRLLEKAFDVVVQDHSFAI
jgi:hypothetical protein